jgi:hypothetical protein
LQARDDLNDMHEELEHRAQTISDRVKAASALSTPAQGQKGKATPTRPSKAASPQKSLSKTNMVTITPILLPESLSDLMRACIE